jgi:hypothetical protein
MKFHKRSLLLATVALSVGLAGTSSAFTAVTNVSGVLNNDTVGGPGADVGDSFTVTGGSFATYFPDAGDPTITGGDLNLYRFNMSGTVTNVSSGVVTYAGMYEIFYDGNSNGTLEPGAGPPDFSYSSGTLDLTVDFTSGAGFGPFTATGMLHQTAGPDAGFPSSGFASSTATFTGTYTQNAVNANGVIQGTVRSVPDGGSSLILLGIAALGTIAAKRKFAS